MRNNQINKLININDLFSCTKEVTEINDIVGLKNNSVNSINLNNLSNLLDINNVFNFILPINKLT